MRSPRYRSLVGQHVRLPLTIAAAVVVAVVGIGLAAGYLLGARDPTPIEPAMPAAAAVTSYPASAGVAVTALAIASGGVDEPVPLAVGESARFSVRVALDDGTSRDDAPVRWFSSDGRVLAVDPAGVATGLALGRARVHAVLPPFDASAAVVVGGAGAIAHSTGDAQPDPDDLVRLEQRLLDWIGWTRARQGLPEVAVDEKRRGALRALAAHALRQGGIDHVDPQSRQYRAAARDGWEVRLLPVGAPSGWTGAAFDDLSALVGQEALSLLTDPAAAQVAVGLVFDGRASDQLWAGVAVLLEAP